MKSTQRAPEVHLKQGEAVMFSRKPTAATAVVAAVDELAANRRDAGAVRVHLDGLIQERSKLTDAIARLQASLADPATNSQAFLSLKDDLALKTRLAAEIDQQQERDKARLADLKQREAELLDQATATKYSADQARGRQALSEAVSTLLAAERAYRVLQNTYKELAAAWPQPGRLQTLPDFRGEKAAGMKDREGWIGTLMIAITEEKTSLCRAGFGELFPVGDEARKWVEARQAREIADAAHFAKLSGGRMFA
jgi:hypothetical protein